RRHTRSKRDWSSDVCSSDLKVRTILTYPPSAGRSIDEIFRVLDSLQQIDKQGVSTPINWQPGEDVVIPPSLSDEDAEKAYPGQEIGRASCRERGWPGVRAGA